MSIKHTIKLIWKFCFAHILRLYSGTHDLYVYNLPTEDISREGFSQFGQDTYALRLLKNKTHGFFIDIGANDPVKGSNTFLLEKLGWKGIAVEPRSRFQNSWKELRTTPCIQAVVGPTDETIIFIEGKDDQHGLSGVQGYNKVTNNSKEIPVPQRTLQSLCEEYSITNIDYLSIDVEGYELEVLKGINFDTLNIHIVNIENDIAFRWIPFIGKKIGAELGNNTIRKIMKSHGYRFVGRIVCDDFYIKD